MFGATSQVKYMKHYLTGLLFYLQKCRLLSLSKTLLGCLLNPRILPSRFCFILHNSAVEQIIAHLVLKRPLLLSAIIG